MSADGDDALPLVQPDGQSGPAGLRALRHRDFRLMWAGQFARGTAHWTQITSVPLLVLLKGGTALDLGITAALQFAPVLLLAPIGGVAADLVTKKPALLAVQVLLVVQSLLLTVVASWTDVGLLPVFGLATVFGVANAIEMPFRQSFVAELVPKPDLLNGIALNQGAFQLTRISAPVIAGVIVLMYGPAPAFAFAAGASLLAALLLLAVRSPLPNRLEAPREVRAHLAAGLRYAGRTPAVLWPLALVTAGAAFGLAFQTLLPIYAVNLPGGDERTYGVLLAASGVGALLAALPAAFAGPSEARRRMTAAAMLLGAGSVLLAINSNTAVALALMVVLGFAFMMMVGSINQVIQSQVRGHMRGRIMGLYVGVHQGGVAAGALVAGAAASVVGEHLVIGAAGLATILIGAFVHARLPELSGSSPTGEGEDR